MGRRGRGGNLRIRYLARQPPSVLALPSKSTRHVRRYRPRASFVPARRPAPGSTPEESDRAWVTSGNPQRLHRVQNAHARGFSHVCGVWRGMWGVERCGVWRGVVCGEVWCVLWRLSSSRCSYPKPGLQAGSIGNLVHGGVCGDQRPSLGPESAPVEAKCVRPGRSATHLLQ